MPTVSTLLVFSLAALALVVVPGPNIIYIVTRGIGQGRRAAVASAFGVETGTLVHVAAAAVGVSALLASSATAFAIVKYLGAGYLIYLGLRALLGRDEEFGLQAHDGARLLRRVYVQGILTNVLNPKVALFFLAFLPQFVDPSRGAAAVQILVLGSVCVLLGLSSDLIYAASSGAVGHWLRRRPAFARRQRYLTGSVYIALGAAAAMTGGQRQRD